jgi:hypothetical protein
MASIGSLHFHIIHATIFTVPTKIKLTVIW